MNTDQAKAICYIYLKNDPAPLGTSLKIDQVVNLINEMREIGSKWCRIPLCDGRDALIDPVIVGAIVPAPEDEDA